MQRLGLDVLYDHAESQSGYLTTRQAGEAGVSTRLLTYYASAGNIHRVAHSVYRLALFPMHRFGEQIAATLRVGPGSAVSMLDRLLHHATVVVAQGESHRMKDARTHRK